MDKLKFGTSGLRGRVSDLTPAACQAHVRAFLAQLAASGSLGEARMLLVGQDLRDSSPRIAEACFAAAAAEGFEPVDCGVLPTPALALEANRLGVPAIMVTGSHIPADRNGLKFYRADGEIDKADERGILLKLAAAGSEGTEAPPAEAQLSHGALDRYAGRYLALRRDLPLGGLRIGVYQHSSVARDLLVEILEGLGAEALPLGRADGFVPVDTEALRPEDVELARDWSAEHRMDAIVSTDGDADRPLIADESGQFLRGDVVGLLTAAFLGADTVVTPVTSTSAVEKAELFERSFRTKVGSPYVIDGMRLAQKAGARVVVGFEANGGVLIGTTATIGGATIEPLPTRDAILPILAVLGLSVQERRPLSALVRALPPRFTASDRLKNVPSESAQGFLKTIAGPSGRADAFVAGEGVLASVDTTDGPRLVLEDGRVIHYRASGNAPELRCYTEAASQAEADALLAWGLGQAQRALDTQIA